MAADRPAPKRPVARTVLAATLPLAVAAGLYLAVEATAPEGASARLTEAGSASATTSDACYERPRRVSIDGMIVDAYAVLCGEDEGAAFALADEPAPEPALHPVVPPTLAASVPPPARIEAGDEPARKPRRAVAAGERSARRAAVADHRGTHHRHYRPGPDPARVASQQKFGP